MNTLYQRAEDGYPVGSDALMREAYGQIPVAVDGLFQDERGYYARPTVIHGWGWSVTFGRWGALVTFESGWQGWTWPRLS